MDPKITISFVDQFWNSSIMPSLSQFVSIPCKSPAFDFNWRQNGFFDEAINLVTKWVHAQNISGLKAETVRLEDYTPCLYIEIPGTTDKTVMFYGHLDKMPESVGWREDLDPWKPVVEKDRLYGRGSVDNGYSFFSAIAAIKSLQAQNLPHDRYVILMETAEECGSHGFVEYLEHLRDKIKNPDLVIVLDSTCADSNRLWLTGSLRGLLTGTLRVDVLTKGIHSGTGSGVVPSSFRIIRQLLDRIEDAKTGRILIDCAHVNIPEDRIKQMKLTANVLGDKIYDDFPVYENCQLITETPHELLLNSYWRPYLSVVGVDGIPSLENASNALRPSTTLMIGIRLPPYCSAKQMAEEVKQILERDPPYGASVTYTPTVIIDGWAAPKMSEHMENIVSDASCVHFGDEPVYLGCGGSIGPVKILGDFFGDTNFIVSGAEVPDSNAHGPNEFLHIPTAKKVTAAIAQILARHSKAD